MIVAFLGLGKVTHSLAESANRGKNSAGMPRNGRPVKKRTNADGAYPENWIRLPIRTLIGKGHMGTD